MGQKNASRPQYEEKQTTRTLNGIANSENAQRTDYSSHGVMDNDVFLLPTSDLQLLGLLTVIAAVVRLFRIYQPSSVVFDEVQ